MYIQPNETILEQANGAFSRPYYLLAVSEAIVVAGSGMRKDNECYRVASKDRDGTRHSRAYKSYTEAKTEFDRVTMPIVAVDA